MSHIVIVAGPNGAGKSTVAPAILKGTLQIDNFVNADIIAQGLCAYQPEKAAIQAGRVMLDRIHTLASDGVDFAFETTLASRSFATWIPRLKKQGYRFHLVFLWLQSVELAVSRVKARVKNGGHFVPEDTVKRRYFSGLKNFFDLYSPLADSWQFYDNSSENNLSLIALKAENALPAIQEEILWGQLCQHFSKKEDTIPEDRISSVMNDPRQITQALQSGIRAALLQHKKLGQSIWVWRDGSVIQIAPEEIEE